MFGASTARASGEACKKCGRVSQFDGDKSPA
jgi:hypothetical protein